MKFKQKINTIFLDSNSENFEINDAVNIVLSPSLYWVKKVNLPLKYVREVKPLLVSLFEDTLPEGNYSYFTYKKEEYFYIFAYEDKVILDTLKDKGINSTQVNNVYFAQSELEYIQNPIKIDSEQNICLKDGLVILLPSLWTENEDSITMDSISHSKHSVRLNQFGHIVDNKSLYMLMSIFLVMITLVFTEYLIVKEKTNKTIELQEDLFLRYGLKSTMMQNRSMLKEYTSLHSKQMKLREYIGYVLAIKLSKKQKLSLLSLKVNKLVVKFDGVVKGSENKILKFLESKKMKFNSDVKSDVLQVEIIL